MFRLKDWNRGSLKKTDYDISYKIPLEATSEWDRDQWRFARLFSQGYDDLLASLKESDGDNVDRLVVWYL
jgi:hypothetical protein